MQCREARKLIPALIDGMLGEEKAAEVRRHMNRCQSCLDLYHAYQEDARAIIEHSRRAPWIPVANDVINRLPEKRSPWWDRLAAGGSQLATVAGVAIVLIVVFAGAYALREMAGEQNGATENGVAVEESADAADPTPTVEPTPPAAEPSPTPEPTPTPEPDPTPEPTPTVEPTPVPAVDDYGDYEIDDRPAVLIYLLRGEEIAASSRHIDDTPRVATAAMEHLLGGVSDREETFGLHSEVPEGVELLYITIDDGVATVDLSEEFFSGGGSLSMQMRVAQVVFTLTQFGTVDEVEFLVEGEPVDGAGGQGVTIDQPLTRDDFEDLSPAILIEGPTPGDVLTDEVRLHGTSNTFEATMQIEIFDAAGEVLYEDFATATSGSGERGTFDLTVPVEPTVEGWGKVVMFEYSARDGSRINVVEIPVVFLL